MSNTRPERIACDSAKDLFETLGRLATADADDNLTGY